MLTTLSNLSYRKRHGCLSNIRWLIGRVEWIDTGFLLTKSLQCCLAGHKQITGSLFCTRESLHLSQSDGMLTQASIQNSANKKPQIPPRQRVTAIQNPVLPSDRSAGCEACRNPSVSESPLGWWRRASSLLSCPGSAVYYFPPASWGTGSL